MLDGTYGYDAVADAHFLMADRIEVEVETTAVEGDVEQSSRVKTSAKHVNNSSGSGSGSGSRARSDNKILLATEGCSCPGENSIYSLLF
jgi:hypothetical protein